MINKIIEDEITKVALTDIDVVSIFNKFKPQIQKRIEAQIKDAIKDFDILEYVAIEDLLVEYSEKVIIPNIKKALFTKEKA